MNPSRRPDIVVIVSDSLRQDHLGCYAGAASPARTPHLDQLLHDGVAFANMYPHGLPTIPVRTEWVTGCGTLAGRSWQPLASTDVTAAEILRREGYVTALFADLYHYFKPDQNFHRGYHEWHWIRGQEYDACCTAPPRRRRVEDYWKDSFPASWRSLLQIVCQNLDRAERAADFPCWRTFELASDWLRRNQDQTRPFLLWVETFDPHEPWTPPTEYDVYGDPAYRGRDYILPPGGPAAAHFTAEEIRRIRSLYAGEVSYVDAMAGQLLQTLRDVGRYDECVVLLMSDHGHPLAEHGKFLKGPDRMHSELLKVPFGIKLPGGQAAGTRTSALAQFPDVLPTLLDAIGMAGDLPAMQGRSLMPVVRGHAAEVRQATISGYHHGGDRCIRDQRWSLVLRPGDQADELYDLAADPGETRNLIDQHPDVVQRLAASFGAAFAVADRPIKGLQGHFEVAHTAAE